MQIFLGHEYSPNLKVYMNLNRKLNISLIELFGHHEVLASYARILLKLSYRIHCLTNRLCYDNVFHAFSEDVSWEIKSEAEKNDDFLAKHWLLLESQDLIIFTTLDIHSIYIRKTLLSPPCLGLVHNSNAFFFPLSIKNLRWTVLHKYIYYLGRLDFLKMNNIGRRLDFLIVPDKNVDAYLRAQIDIHLGEKLRVLPIAIPEKHPKICNSEKIRITIPGSVRQIQRDYDLLLEILPILDQKISAKIEIYLLGKISGRRGSKISTSIQALDLQNITLFQFGGSVSGKHFDEIMDSTDFLWLPLQLRTNYRANHEYRGKTCVSGNINDMVRFALPAILPSFYPLHPDLEMLTGRYQNQAELLHLLQKWIHHQTFNRIKQTCVPCIDHYYNQVMLAFQEIITEIISRSRG